MWRRLWKNQWPRRLQAIKAAAVGLVTNFVIRSAVVAVVGAVVAVLVVVVRAAAVAAKETVDFRDGEVIARDLLVAGAAVEVIGAAWQAVGKVRLLTNGIELSNSRRLPRSRVVQ